MRFSDDAAQRICRAILARWTEKRMVRKKATDDVLLAKMVAELSKDVAREEALDREVEALIEKHSAGIDATQVNSRLMFQKIKQRLAEERGIVL
jgi:hypothetical protein